MIMNMYVCGEGKERYSLHSMSQVGKLKLDLRNIDFYEFLYSYITAEQQV